MPSAAGLPAEPAVPLASLRAPIGTRLARLWGMHVADLMTSDVWTLGPDATIADAAAMMWERGIGCVPIIDDERYLIGIVTARDLCIASYGRELPMTKLPVIDAMTGLVYTVGPDARVADVDAMMRTYRIRRVPVSDRLGRLVGIVCLSDVARAALGRTPNVGTLPPLDVVRTLASACEPRESAWLLKGWG